MNTIITQKKVILGSTLRDINKARILGQLNLKPIKIASIINKLRKNLISDDDCVKKSLDKLFIDIQRKYKLCNYRDKVINNLNTNMATYTININPQPNQPPTIGDGEVTIAYEADFLFTRESLTTQLIPSYSDPENDEALNLRIDSLPVNGILELNSIPVSVNDEIPFSLIDSGSLLYDSDNLVTDGDIQTFNFNISDEGSGLYSLNNGTFTINIQAQVNQAPSQLGDGDSTIAYGSSLTFTRALLTTMLSPAYVDPEGDAAQNLRVNTLPIRGTLELNSNPISVSQIISFTDIDAGLLIYQPDLADTDGDQVNFDFSVSDVGSGQFTT